MKILRLSLFNLKKNKKEAIAIAFLTMITAFMLGIFAENISKMDRAFDESFTASGSVNRIILFEKNRYRDEYRTILENEYHPADLTENEFINALATDVLEKNGDTLGYNLLFDTERTERRIGNFVKLDALSDETVATLAHPIWLPISLEISKGYLPGDMFTIVKGGENYPFVVAGFYEPGLMSSMYDGYKVVLSEDDFELFSILFRSDFAGSSYQVGLCFNADNDFQYGEYIDKCMAASSEDIKSGVMDISYDMEKWSETQFLLMLLYLIAFLSVITMIASLFMIRNKISNDIEDQMRQIGVLEALGYRSGEISLAYLLEYVIAGGAGSIVGGVAAFAVSPAMTCAIRTMLGRNVRGNFAAAGILLASILVACVVLLFALIKVRVIKRYPPVVAFRKGIKTHHFGRNVLPLERLKWNVNVRLALKSVLEDIKSGIGIAICIVTAGTMILFCILCFDFFKEGTNGLMQMTGYDVDAVSVSLMSGVEPYKIRDEIASMSEVRKSLVGFDITDISVKGSDNSGTGIIFEDYRETENIIPTQGRYPEHDNEVMITTRRSVTENLAVGDSIVLEGNGVEESYIITGIVSSLMNSGTNLYLTSDGYLRINGNARPSIVSVYLADGVSEEAFEEKLKSVYGDTAKDRMGTADTQSGLEERIRAVAEEKMAAMISRYGVTGVDYAIQIGDQLITGNSRHFVIKEISSLQGIFRSQMEVIATLTRLLSLVAAVLVAGIVAVILWMIASSNVRRQRANLGIMKGLGYASKDLMTQMAIRILPVTIFAMVIASFCAVHVYKAFWMLAFGTNVKANLLMMLATDVILVVFCYLVTYIGAGKVKRISVTELMTE